MQQILVIGGGAAGLMAAIAAAENGAGVTVLEGMEKPGKKLLITGNGRCNLTNLDESLPLAYHATSAGFADHVLHRYNSRWLMDFFAENGMLTRTKEQLVYPASFQAASVTELLLREVSRRKVKLKCGEKIVSIAPYTAEDGRPRWKASTKGWTYTGDSLILAAGSQAAPQTGSDGSGYALARMAGHTIIPPHPGLVPLTVKEKAFRKAEGARCQARLTLTGGNRVLGEETGELQWTSYGVSGIAVFQLSRLIDPSLQPLILHADLFPEWTVQELEGHLCHAAERYPNASAGQLLRGLLPARLADCIGNLAPKGGLAACLKQLTLTVTGTRGFDQAQIAVGGVDTQEADPQTMESRLARGLYFAGEVLDVDGPCGGYNLQWAFASGAAAGAAAAGKKGNL